MTITTNETDHLWSRRWKGSGGSGGRRIEDFRSWRPGEGSDTTDPSLLGSVREPVAAVVVGSDSCDFGSDLAVEGATEARGFVGLVRVMSSPVEFVRSDGV